VTHDEECEGTGSGACPTPCGSTGSRTCRTCSWTDCAPPTEVCNSRDDDCDEAVDEGANACGGVCTLAIAPATVCDGSDADRCLDDVYECNGLNATVCSTGTDTIEICDGEVDEDCDGLVDEGAFPEPPPECIPLTGFPPPADGIYVLFCYPGETIAVWAMAESGWAGGVWTSRTDWQVQCEGTGPLLCKIRNFYVHRGDGNTMVDINVGGGWGCPEDTPFVWIFGQQLCEEEIAIDRRTLNGHSCFFSIPN